MGDWISVKDRLPEISDNVLSFNGTEVGQDVYTVFNGEHMFYSETVCPEEVTHWMPLPPPPEGD